MPEFHKKTFTDEEIIEGLKNGGKKTESQQLEYLYKSRYDMILSYILKNNGTNDDAKDIFQQAIIAFYENIKSGKYVHQSKISTYIFEIVKNMWINILKHKKIEESYIQKNTNNISKDNPEDKIAEKEKKRFVKKIMEKLKQDCREILIYSIYNKYSMQEIAEIMGFKNSQVARNKKNLCLESLKSIIRNSNLLLQELNTMRFTD